MTTGPSWHRDVRARAPFPGVAGALGLTKARHGFGPCPACNGSRRGSADERPPVIVTADGRGWRCFACGAKGDVLDLVAFRLAGSKLAALDERRRVEVRAWFAAGGWCEPAAELSPVAKVAVELFEVLPPKGDRTRWRAAWEELRRREETGELPPAESAPALPPVKPRPEPPCAVRDEAEERPPPPPGEVAALWAACRRLDGSGGVGVAADWLWLRGLVPSAVAALGLARVLPEAYPWPAWVPSQGMTRGAWLAVYRIAVPMFAPSGALAALRFRAVDQVRALAPGGAGLCWTAPPGCRFEDRAGSPVLVADVRGKTRTLPKAVASRGVGHSAGLVLADPWGLALLRGARDVDGVPWDGSVLIAEGEIDLWAATSSAGRFRAGGTFAAFGVGAGCWTSDLAARVPDGARVTVATDADGPGDKYAEAVRASLAGRCHVRRMESRAVGGDHAEHR